MLDWTGERFLPWIQDTQMHYEHLHRYAFATNLVRGKKVLDMACGEGYGSYMLAREAESVIGIDIDEPTINHASGTYVRDNLKFIIGSILKVPLNDDKLFDIIVCFEAIEHVKEHVELLSEVKRLLKGEGLFIVSTPNKTAYTDEPQYHNPFHLKELYLDEFKSLLSDNFKYIYVLGQRVYAGSNLWGVSFREQLDYQENIIKKGEKEYHLDAVDTKIPRYYIALASDIKITQSISRVNSWLIDISDGLFKDYQRQIQEQNIDIEKKKQEVSRLSISLSAKDTQLEGLKTELENKYNQLSESNKVLESQNTKVQNLVTDIQNKNFQIKTLNNDLEDKVTHINELNNSLQAKNVRITELETDYAKETSKITELNNSLQSKDTQIKNLKTDLVNRESQISLLQIQMQQSITLKLQAKYQTIIEKFFRTGTRRRYYYELGLTGLRVIIDEGLQNFFRKTKHWLGQKRSFTKLKNKHKPSGKLILSQAKAKANKIQFPVSSERTEVSIVIPVYNKLEYTINCLDSIYKNTSGDYEVIVVDDCSSNETSKILSKIRNLKFLRKDTNSGFIDSCNRGAEISHGKYVLFLNNDTLVTSNWLPPLLETMTGEDVGAAGAKLIYPDGKLQEAGGIIWNDGSGWNYGRGDDTEKPEYNYMKEVDYCSGACLIVKRELFNRIGGFDERFKPGYYEDTDLCFALRDLGYKIIYQPLSRIVHFEGVTSGTDVSSGVKSYQVINKQKFVDKWHTNLQKMHYDPDQKNLHIAKDRRTGKHILIIDHYVPTHDRDAGSLRMFNILKILCELGHKVTFIGDNLLQSEPYTHELQQIGIEIIYAPYVLSVIDFVKEFGKQFDFIVLSRPHIAIKYIDLVKNVCTNAKLIYDTVDLVFLRESRRANLENKLEIKKQAAISKNIEFYLMKKSDVTFVVSPVEKELLLQEDNSLNVNIISLIYQVKKSPKTFQDRKNILFIGGFAHPPNADAVKYFVNQIFPLVKRKLNDLRFYIVGSDPTAEVRSLHSKDIIVTGYIKDLTAYIEDCRVFVAPLRYGAGIKGKITESMSYGLPVTTSSIGAEGIGLVDGENAFIADEPIEFAEKLIEVYSNEILWNKLSLNSVEHIRRHYSPEAMKEKLKSIF